MALLNFISFGLYKARILMSLAIVDLSTGTVGYKSGGKYLTDPLGPRSRLPIVAASAFMTVEGR